MEANATVGTNGRRRLTASASACGVLLVGVLSHAPARAAWEAVPKFEINAQTEENPRLNPVTQVTDTTAATSAMFWASADIATVNERSSLTFVPSVTSYQYADASDSELESTDPSLNSSGEYRWQKVTAGFRSLLSDERLLSSELVAVDPDGNPDTQGPDSPDSGRLAFIDEKQERIWFNPYVGFQISERNSLRLDATKDHISYSGGNLPFRTGYDDTRVSAGIHRNVDEQNLVSAVMSAERYEADVNQNKTDTVTIEGAFTRPLTELWTLDFAAGVLRSDYQFLGNNEKLTDRATTDYTMRLGFRKRAERSRVNVDFARWIYPSTSGYSSVRREVIMYYDRDLTQRLGASFGVRVNETKSLGDVSVQDNRDYARAEIDFEWALKPVLFLRAGYNYTAQDFTEDIFRDKAKSHSIYIGMSYRGMSKR